MESWKELVRHFIFDFAALIPVGILLAAAMGAGIRKKAIQSASMAAVSLAVIVVSAAHIKFFNTIVDLPYYDWSHIFALLLVYCALALPLTYLSAKNIVPAGWVLAVCVVLGVVVASQAAATVLFKKNAVEEVRLRRDLMDIEKYIQIDDYAGFSRAIGNLKIPKDPENFDLIYLPILIDALHNAHPTVVAAAAKKIAERGDTKLLPNLLEILNGASPESKRVIQQAIDALSANKDAAFQLLGMVATGDVKKDREAFEYIVGQHPTEIDRAMRQLFANNDPELVKYFANMIRSGTGGSNGSKIVEALTKFVGEKDPRLSGGAVLVLADLADLPDIRKKLNPAPLVRMLGEGKKEYQAAAIKLLKSLSGEKVVPALIIAAGSGDYEISTQAVGALVEMKAKDAREVFAKSIESHDGLMRTLGYEGLKSVLPRETPPTDPIIARIDAAAKKERDRKALRAAVELMAWLDMPGAYDSAEGLIAFGGDDPDKLSGIASFDLLGDQRAVKTLLTLARDHNPEIRKAAIMVLGRVGDSSLIPELQRLAEDSEEEIRAAVKEAIAEVAGKKPGQPPVPQALTPEPDSLPQ